MGGYDIEYDDDELEHGVKPEWVREVKRLPFHVRMQMKAQEEAEQEAKAKEEAEQEAKAKEEAGQEAEEKIEKFKHKHSKVPRPALADAVGYEVEVDSHEPDALEGDAFPGVVHSVDVSKNTLTVSFEVDEGAPPDYQEMDYYSHDISWAAKGSAAEQKVELEAEPAPETEPELEQSAFPFAAEDGDEGVPLETKREKMPLLAVGTRVEGNYLGAGQWYKGVIIGAAYEGYDIEYDDDELEHGVKPEWVREVKRLPFHVRMQMKAQEEAEQEAKAKEEAEQEANAKEEAKQEAEEKIEKFKHKHSKIPRPALADAVGYEVEVDSHEPDALEGDAFPGVVHSVDVSKNTLT